MSSFEKCAITLNLAGKIRPGEIKEAAAVYEQRGMAANDAMIKAVEDRLEMAEMEVKSINDQVAEAYAKKRGKKADPVAAKTEPVAEVQAEVEEEVAPEIKPSNRKPTFYSQLERQIGAAKMATQPGAQWQTWLNANAAKLGIKKDEIEWSGINDYLTMRAGEKVAKSEIVEYLKANGVQVQEVGKGGRTPDALKVDELIRLNKLRDEFRARELTAEETAEFRDLKRRDDAEAEADIKPTKYGKYTLPGGREYRELLLTLPTKHDGSDYRSSHWDEDNIVAHIRYNDRTDASGARVLFIEELQSDWGQDGLKKGFRQQQERELDELIRQRDTAESDEQASKIQDKISKMVGQAEPGPSAAPFVTKTESWLQLGIKRMIVHAVQNGYDKVAFVNGQQSAARYDLSKQVGSVYYTKDGVGKGTLVAMPVGSTINDSARPVMEKDDVGTDDLEGLIGKDLAKKLLDAPVVDGFQSVIGPNLKVGGEGMIAFYDKIVPQNVNDVLKKLGGGKIEMVNLGSADKSRRYDLIRERRDMEISDPRRALLDSEIDRLSRMETGAMASMVGQPGFAITDAMREKVEDGVPMFSNRQPVVNGQHYQLPAETRNAQTRRALQDYFIRVKEVQTALVAQGGTIGEAQDVYQAEELSYGRMQEQMRDFKEQVVKPLLKDAQKADLTLAELAMYAYAKHARERNQAMGQINPKLAPGTGSGMTDKEASDILNQFRLDGKDQALSALHARLMAITSTTRQLLLAEGLITTDEFTAWDGKYDNYVPLRGFIEDEIDVVDGAQKRHGRTAGKGFNIRGAESTRALGRTSLAGHVIENIFNDYERAVARVERNDVAKVFLNLVTTNPDPDLWEIDAVRTTASFNKGTQTVTYNQLIDKGEDTVSVKVGGKEVYIKVKDPLLVRALRQASTDETGATTRILMKYLGWYTAYMRNVLTRFNPAFGITNAVRDFGFGAVSVLADLGPSGVAKFVKNYATSAGANVRAEFDRADPSKPVDRMYAEFRAAGATTGGFHMRDLQEMRKELQNLVVEYGGVPVTTMQKLIATKGIRQAYKAGKATLRILELAGSLSENQARFAAFRTAREMGKSPAAAASIAKNLTTNFNRKGEWGSALNTLFLFFNAGVQGTDKMMKNLKKPGVQALMAGTVGMTVGLALMGASMGGDDDDGQPLWDKIPQFEKERNLIIMLPPSIEMNGTERVGKTGRYIKIPVQYGLNVFTSMGYTLADLARHGKDKTAGVTPGKAAVNSIASVFGAFNPMGGAVNIDDPVSIGMAVAPSIADVGIQFGAGVDGFGRPTSPAKSPFDTKPDSENYGPSMAGTWEQRVAAWVNDATGGDAAVPGAVDLAPGTVRNLKRNLAGGTGDFVSSVLVNIPSKLMSENGELEHRDVPVLKTFYGKVDDNVNLGLYYERKAEAAKAADEAKRRMKLGIEFGYRKEDELLQDLGTRAEYYTGQMTMLRKAELEVMGSKELTEPERKLQVQQIKKERGALARAFNAEFMEMKKEAVK